MRQYNFEKLEIWQLARELTTSIYRLTREFPESERYGLTNQLRRAAISVSSNIAEGSSRSSSKDRSRFIEIAFGSLMEVLSQLIISCDLGYIQEDAVNILRPSIEKLGNKMNAYKKSIIR